MSARSPSCVREIPTRWSRPTSAAAAVSSETAPRQSRDQVRSKLEIDEGIAVSLGENDRGEPQCPETDNKTAGHSRHDGLDRGVAQIPVGEKQTGQASRFSSLENFPGGQNRVTLRTGITPAIDPSEMRGGHVEVRGSTKENPRNAHHRVGAESEQRVGLKKTFRPGSIPE